MNNLLLVINITLMYSAPLILAALGGLFSEKVGIINIGIEGVMTVGAISSILVTYYTNNPWLGLFFAGISGLIFSLLHAISSITFKSDQIISGIALNFIGSGISLLLCRRFFNGSNVSPSIQNKLPKILNWLKDPSSNIWTRNLNIDVTFLIAIFLAFLTYILFYKTKWGLRIISIGENQNTADTLGIDVIKIRYICTLISGFITGLGGAACCLSIVSVFSPTVVSGRGFIALSAIIFGKWTPHGIVCGCLLFGLFQALVILLGNNSFIPSQFLSMFPYVLTIFILVMFLGNTKAPKSLGVPFIKNKKY